MRSFLEWTIPYAMLLAAVAGLAWAVNYAGI